MDNNKILEAGTREQKEITTAAETQKQEENKYLIKFRKPFIFEDETYKEIDLSGLEDLSAKDMIQAQRTMERSGSINVLPEMSLEYACLISARASGKPVEFFKALPPKEALKIKNRVTNFLYGED